jgi:predicted DNA-binding transcriptional regulator YafY
MNDRSKIGLAMANPDTFVIRMVYLDDKGKRTRRVVSPIRYGKQQSLNRFYMFQALCLSRQEPRWFKMAGCQNIELLRASDVLMPLEIEVLSEN